MNRSRAIFVLFVSSAALLSTSCTREARARRQLSTGNAQFAAGRYDSAEIAYKNVLQLQPLNADAIGTLGRIYQAEGRTGPAIAYLNKAKELRPNDVPVRVSLASALLAAGAAQRAHEEATFALKQKPDDPDAPLLLAESARTPTELATTRATLDFLPSKPAVLVAQGQLRVRTGAIAEGQRLFAQAAAADPKFANARAALGMLAWSQKDLPSANGHLKVAAELAPARSPLRLQYVGFKLQTGDTSAGRMLLQQLTQETPDYLPAWLALIELATNDKDYSGAEAMLREALARDSTNPELLLLGARIQLAQGNNDKAVAELERVIALYPRSPAGLYLLGNAYTAKGDLDKAAEAMSRTLTVVPEYSPAIVALADLNVRRGNYAAAVTALKPLAAAHPELMPAQLLLAQAYRGIGDSAAALAIYQRIERDAPGNPQLPYLRGLTLRDVGQLAAARAAFETAAALNPSAIEPVQRLVELDLADKSFSRAVARVQEALPKLPKSAEPYLLLGTIHLAGKDLAAAQNAFELAVKAQPDSPAAHGMLARIYIATNQRGKAIEQMQAAAASNPTDAEALTTLAVLYELTDQDQLAIEAYNKVLEVDPKSVAALNNLAGLLARDSRQLDRANTLAERARSLAPNDPSVADTLGWVLYQRGAYPQALALLREASTRLPDQPEVQFHLGMCHYMDGNEALAKLSLEAAAKASLPPSEAELSKRKLAVLAIDPRSVTSEHRAVLDTEVAQSPIDPAAAIRLAALYQREGSGEKARTLLQSAVRVTPKNPRVLLALALCLAKAGDKSAALDIAREGHALAPGDAEITALLGQLAYDSAQYRWAAALLEEAVGQIKDDPTLLFSWANAAYAVGRVSEAEQAARQALAASTEFPNRDDAASFVDLLSIAAHPDGAKSPKVTATLQKNPAYPPALVAQAALQENRKDVRASRQTYETVIKVLPEFAPAYRALAILYAMKLDGSTAAASVATKARQMYPNDPEVARAAGIISYYQGDYPRAATLLRESTAAVPNDCDAVFYLGMAQFQLKRPEQAKQALERALELGLSTELAQQARRTLALAK